MTFSFKLLVICISTIGFSVVYHLRPKYIFYSTAASVIAAASFLLLDLLDLGIFFPNFVATVFTVLFIEIISRIVKIPSSIIQIPGILPLVPGRALYYTMSAVLNENFTDAFENALILVKTALAIAIGITVTSVCFRFIMSALGKIPHQKH